MFIVIEVAGKKLVLVKRIFNQFHLIRAYEIKKSTSKPRVFHAYKNLLNRKLERTYAFHLLSVLLRV